MSTMRAVQLSRYGAPSQLTIVDLPRFQRIVATAFGQRRKMLRKTLETHAEAMEAVGIAPTARAEEVATETWVALANHGVR